MYAVVGLIAESNAIMDGVSIFGRGADNPDRAAAEAFPQATDDVTTWLRDAGRGNEDAFARVYDELAPFVHGCVLRVIRDPAQSEEVTQEVFVELWRLAPRFDATRGTVRAWAMTIAHRRAVDRVRSSAASRSRDAYDAARPAPAPATPEEAVGDRIEQHRVRRALDSLSDRQREAVELAYYAGHTYREVAALLDVPEGTIKTRIRDGLIRLRGELGDLP